MLLACLTVVLAACSGVMKVPGSVSSSVASPVARESGLREGDLHFAGARISDIRRDSNRPTGRGLVNFEKAFDETRVAFRFQVGDVGLDGECVEQLKANLMGLKRPKVFLKCSCKAEDQERAKLALEQYQGHAELESGVRYEVSSLHETTRGKTTKDVLGYWFKGSEGQGAVDLQGDERVWLPPKLVDSDRPLLLCLVGALLVYKPSESF
jgi:hypothetical protein